MKYRWAVHLLAAVRAGGTDGQHWSAAYCSMQGPSSTNGVTSLTFRIIIHTVCMQASFSIPPPASTPPALQDFTQAELLLALRVVSDPNGLFMCGDTCQTIARGIGFRCVATLDAVLHCASLHLPV